MSRLKYVDTAITFAEVPDEITLCFNIANCPHRCKGCHSEYLQRDIGEFLTKEEIERHLGYHNGITCVCFLGGDSNLSEISELADVVHKHGLKAAWYTGLDFHLNSMQEIADRPTAQKFDYVKTGPYIESLGPLNKKTTNQRMYKKVSDHPILFEDITNRFWKN